MIDSTKTKVAEYKGFEIYFDSFDGTFSVEGYEHCKENKKSFNACKTYINKFVKENSLFGSFKIAKLPTEGGPEIATVTGIHQNGNLMAEKENGDKFQISTSYKYEMQKWCLPEELEKSEYSQERVDELEAQIREIRSKISQEEKKLPSPCVEVFKKVLEENKHLWK